MVSPISSGTRVLGADTMDTGNDTGGDVWIVAWTR
jgi:hypothetical protein